MSRKFRAKQRESGGSKRLGSSEKDITNPSPSPSNHLTRADPRHFGDLGEN